MPRKLLNRFFGGISVDSRLQTTAQFELCEHFDPFTSPGKLIPHREMEANETTAQDITCFTFHSDQLYGLGKKGGGAGDDDYYKIYEKSGDVITGSWIASTSGIGGINRNENALVPYNVNGTDFLFGFGSTSNIWAYNIDTPGVTDAAYSTGTFSTAVNGIVTRDGLLLMPFDNKIAKKDGGTTNADNWSTALTLPNHYQITDITEWGDYAVIAVKPKAAVNRMLPSKLFIWDKVSEDITDVADFGEGDLELIGNIEGTIVGVMIHGGATSVAIKPRLLIKIWSGGANAREVIKYEVPLSTDVPLSITANKCKAIDDNKMVFGLDITLNGTEHTGLWAVGKVSSEAPWALTKYIKADNDTAATSIEAIYKLGNYFFVAHNNNGSINVTNDQAANSFRATSGWTTQKLDGSDDDPANAWKLKQLKWIAVYFEPLAALAKVNLYMRKNHETAWTTIKTFTEAASTANTFRLQASELSDGTDFPQYREIQFKVETVGQAGGGGASASLLGLEFEYNVVDSDDISE